MIKIYTHHEFLTADNQNYFFPFLTELILLKDSLTHSKYSFTDTIENCDVLILPLAINHFLDNNKEIVHFFKVSSKK